MATPSSRYQDERAVHLISSRPRAVQRVLHRDGVRLAEQLLVERPQRVVDGPRGGAKPFSLKDRSSFLDGLERVMRQAAR